MHVLAEANLRLDANAIDYVLLAFYFTLVLGIGYLARRQVSTSLDFFLSGRSLPAWVTGLAFIAANLGAIEVMGMSANGAQYGMPTAHYFWIGAVPAMLFLGVVMMPFYYGSKVRSVPEFMLRRFNPTAHLVNGISFATAQILIAGANLFLLASVINLLLGWPIWVSVILAAVIVLTYTALGGLSAAIYNEVLQFFVIVAALLPLTIVGLHKVGGWQGLVDRVSGGPGGAEQLSTWPGNQLTGFGSNFLSVLGLVFGLGFVLSFGYWTTNFVEVQRAMASKSMSAARRTPIIGAFPKMFIPFIVIIPGMIAGVTVTELMGENKAALLAGEGAPSGATFNDALLLLIRDLLPNGMLGIAIAGLLASFMAGMAANLSSFNTVFTYDIWQSYIKKDRPDGYYLRVGRVVTAVATILAIGTAFIASTYANLMDYLQQLFSFFNAPLFATFILGMFWKRMTPTAGWTGLVSGILAAVGVFALAETGVWDLPGQGAAFVGAGAAFVVDIAVSVAVTSVTAPKPDAQLVGLVYSLTPKETRQHIGRGEDAVWYRRPVLLAGIALAITILLNIIFF
ncbi:solute:Na+ symporter, SSS family [Amycolatopsis arida]|uniref:Solute:Na+ symporter, SSS family n=1 Tax=Amycolatopsis arida TaxID=587909 RepID=A0A1I5L698_9PSEU|nr:sodium:solute symporter family protein [Amycolatopsis arida]TDX93596.1 SSS family solute:Na+ symporter [Amycolatopsis arida]SFO92693.1 solute:Na+ symporter, SSS family [Amycolatopsis arida]